VTGARGGYLDLMGTPGVAGAVASAVAERGDYADRSMEVVGKGAVTVLDGSSIQTDAHQAKGHRPIMISGAVVHSLPDGSWFDLRARTLLAGAPGMEREASE